MWNSKQHRLTPTYDILRSFMTLVKHHYVTYVDIYNKPFKINCKFCNGYVKWVGNIEELIYINFHHVGKYTL